MRTLRRPITAVLLLSSYTLASVGVWLHTSGVCRVAPRDRDSCAAPACCGIRHTSGGPNEPVERAAPASGWCADAPGQEPAHEHDACLLCRFSVISKGMALCQDTPTPSTPVCRPVAIIVPRFAATERRLPWCCRAPPSVSSLVS
jgi:hypothetical protein